MQAVVLAAGQGKRLKKFYPEFPKPLIPIKGRPLVSYGLDKIIKAGIRKIYIVIDPKQEGSFREILKDYPLRYLYQKKAQGTARALLSAERLIKKDFLLSYCDLITDFNYKRLIKFHLKYKPTATLVLKKDAERDNEVLFKKRKVIKIVEKPEKSFSSYTAIGVMCLSPEIFKYLKRLKISTNKEFHIPDALELIITQGKEIRYIKTTAFRININRKNDIDFLKLKNF